MKAISSVTPTTLPSSVLQSVAEAATVRMVRTRPSPSHLLPSDVDDGRREQLADARAMAPS